MVVGSNPRGGDRVVIAAVTAVGRKRLETNAVEDVTVRRRVTSDPGGLHHCR